mmetsp:Transcript_29837/g.59905  ORF Transcript_29837/g.59905 Transcript_29837/m.59905 type:complete len:118 (-) Transcript_29837:180-533(-)
MRSVILFNCWADGPPLDVPARIPDEEAPSASPQVAELLRAQPRRDWEAAGLHPPKHSGDGTRGRTMAMGKMKVWLLGDERRRGQLERTRAIPVDEQAMLMAFKQPMRCTRFADAEVL